MGRMVRFCCFIFVEIWELSVRIVFNNVGLRRWILIVDLVEFIDIGGFIRKVDLMFSVCSWKRL